jgi:serine/threonine-protein kinase
MKATSTAVKLRDRAALLQAVQAAGILAPAQEKQAAKVATANDANAAAEQLVAAGLLTPFQANRLLSGRTDGFILGQYAILDQVGRGSLSRVYKAKHRTMHRAVAIKVLASELTRTAEVRQTFQREARGAGKLSHPNIVTAYDANELHDRFYLVLEFVDGPTLESLVRQRGALAVSEACEFVRQIANGLQHAHEHGMVHRDLTPGNLLVARPSPSAGFAVKIANFGFSRFATTETPEYVAPEQLQNPQLSDARADLYSLGCIFYFLLTGRSPFAGGSVQEIAQRHLREEPARIEYLRPDVSPELATIIHRLLVKHPVGRFASAAELLLFLEAACVPVAYPIDAVAYDLPQHAGNYATDSGFLTGRHARPQPQPVGSGSYVVSVVESSPWSELTNESNDTAPHALEHTPVSYPRSKSASRGAESVPMWMTLCLLLGVVALCAMGIGVLLRVLK